MSTTGEPPRPDEGTPPNPKLDPIFQFLEAISQRYQKDLQPPGEPAPEELTSQLDRALKHLERGPWAERVAAELPYGIAMALGAWLVEGFADRYESATPSDRPVERREPRTLLEGLLAAEPITVELSRPLVWMVTGEAPLLAKIGALRRYFARNFGLIVPGIRCRDNLTLSANTYVVQIDDLPVASGEIEPRQLLAVGPDHRFQELGLTSHLDPVYSLPCAWIPPERREELEAVGCLIVHPCAVLMTHLTQMVRRHGYKLLGRQQVTYLLKLTERTHPALVREARRRMNPGLMRKVLQNLAFEQLSIRRLPTLLEALLDEAEHSSDADLLTAAARRSLERQLTLEYESPAGVLHALTVSPELSDELRLELTGRRLRLDRKLNQTLRLALQTGLEALTSQGLSPVVVIDPDLRWAFKRWTCSTHPDLVVLAIDELSPEVELIDEGMLGLDEVDEIS